MLKVIAALVPSAGLLFLFWLALKALIEADRRERAAEAKLTQAEHRVEQGGVAGSSRAAGPADEADGGSGPEAGTGGATAGAGG